MSASSSSRRRTVHALLASALSALALAAVPMTAEARYMPSNARGTDVSAADQQAPRDGGIMPQTAPNTRGTDVAAPDQQAPQGGGIVIQTAPNARGTDVSAPDQQAPRTTAPASQPLDGGGDETPPLLVFVAAGAIGLALLGAGLRLIVHRRHSHAAA